MAFPKDQHDSGTHPEPYVGSNRKPAIPITAGPPADPQKTNVDGPDFDFSAPEVLLRAAELRAETARVLSICSRAGPASAAMDAGAYAGLRDDLEAAMPAFYRAYDAYVSSVLHTGDRPPSCSRGCSHCCRHYVESVEPFELIFLHGRIASRPEYPSAVIAVHRRAALFRSLRREGDGELAEDKALYRYYLRGVPCPFLGQDGACGAYSMRPMSCRMFFSMSSPELCKGKGVVDARNRNFLIELPEDIEADLARAGAALSGLGFSESLFEGLAQANEAFARFEPSSAPRN